MEIGALQFAIITLAIWRITHLFQAEDGPWDLIFKLRRVLGNSFWGTLMDCFFCLSLWIALPFGIYTGNGWLQKIILSLAFSGGAILLQKLTNKDDK